MQIDSQFVLTQTDTQPTTSEANQTLDWATLIARELEQAKAYERNLATKNEPAPLESRAPAPSAQILLPDVEKDREGRQKEELKQQVWKEQFREEVKQAIDIALADAPPEIHPLEGDSLSLHAVFLNEFNAQMDSEVIKLQAECSKMSEDLANAARSAHKLLVTNLLSLEALPPPVSSPAPTVAPVVSSLIAPPATTNTADEWEDSRSIEDPQDDTAYFSADED